MLVEEVDAVEVDGAQVKLSVGLVLLDEGDAAKSCVLTEAELDVSHTVTFTGEQR